jgi:hypothetical protein
VENPYECQQYLIPLPLFPPNTSDSSYW